VDAGSNTTDWIIAVASVFAAVGTVGAVIVALWQILRQGARSLVVKCSGAVIGDTPAIRALTLRATNDGSRPINLTMAYLMTRDGQQVVSPFLRYSEQLPKVLLEGQSVNVIWSQENLAQVKDREGIDYLYAFFMDVLGNVYEAPYPGVTVKKSRFRRRITYLPPDPSVAR
jgi:hypothetical protein